MGVITNIKTGLKIENAYLVWKVLKSIENWPMYFLDFFSLTWKRRIIYRMRNGKRYSVRAKTSDRGVITAVCLADEYGINRLPIKGDIVVIDIGANIGAFTVHISHKAKKIFAYEPVPDNFNILLENIKMNNLTEIVVPFKLAVSDRKGVFDLFMAKDNLAKHSVYGTGKQRINVESTTLKEIFDIHNIRICDVLKIDAEGSEYGILYAFPGDYFDRINTICLEHHNINSLSSGCINSTYNNTMLQDFLKRKGFKITSKLDYFFAQRC